MGRSYGQIDLEHIDVEEVSKFFNWLQGKGTECSITSEYQPQLSPEEAFSVIYYLQEEMEILPDNIEMCRECGELFDSDAEGTCISEESKRIYLDESGEELTEKFPKEMYGNYCDNCRPD